jgi:2-haloacid dehalogenase/putative hydrolase of the HAD superfamily
MMPSLDLPPLKVHIDADRTTAFERRHFVNTRYKALLLDFYGTLVEEDDAVIGRIVSRIAEASPVTDDPRAVLRAWDFAGLCAASFGDTFRTQRELEQQSLEQLLAQFQVDLDADSLSQELFTYWRKPTAFPSAGDFLRTINVPVCLVSNIDNEDLAEAIRHNGWQFDLVITSEDCRAYKPRSEPFIRALASLGLATHEVLHAGDSLGSDVAGARLLGIDSTWINTSNRPMPGNPDRTPTYVVRDIAEVSELIAH